MTWQLPASARQSSMWAWACSCSMSPASICASRHGQASGDAFLLFAEQVQRDRSRVVGWEQLLPFAHEFVALLLVALRSWRAVEWRRSNSAVMSSRSAATM
ncbi:MAG: hypothetical protein ABS61_11365 [Microbacterium sp. SCN 70-18]|nr:MAG: hypothetical protein ABS61_11365 [Microbacterium sp. SCN 70-18]